MLLGQVLNLKLLLVDGTLVLKARLLLPLCVNEIALDWVSAILLSEGVVDSNEGLVLTVEERKNWLISSAYILFSIDTQLVSKMNGVDVLTRPSSKPWLSAEPC